MGCLGNTEPSENTLGMTPQNGVMTSSNGSLFCVTGPLWGKSTGHPHLWWIEFLRVSHFKMLPKLSESDHKAITCAWWRHQMETFSALLSFCEGNSPVTGEFPAQRPVTRSFDVLFDLRLNIRLSKQSQGWWLSAVPDLWDRNKILSGGDLSHYQVTHCIRVFFYFVWFVYIHHNFQFYFELCTYCNILDIYLS